MGTDYKVGDTVWVARPGVIDKHITCPHCMGRKYVTVIFGDGEQATVDCGLCACGYNPPTGLVKLTEWDCNAVQTAVTGVETRAESGGVKTRYYTLNGLFEESEVGNNEEWAHARAAELAENHRHEEKERLEQRKEYESKKWAWNASYHRRQLKEALRQTEYHAMKLNVAKAHVKDEPKKQIA